VSHLNALDVKRLQITIVQSFFTFITKHNLIHYSISLMAKCNPTQLVDSWSLTITDNISTYSILALVPLMSTMDVWRGIT